MVYHFTDVHNAAKIIAAGRLYSRAEADRLGIRFMDAASQSVISNTNPAHKQFARLYFRPLTPTQYRNEGIRPVGDRWNNAHCPVPVFLCFQARHVLGLDETEFSDGNMGSGHVSHGGTLEFFKKIPFEYVFHNGSYSPDLGDIIKFHRHAEILVPGSLVTDPRTTMVVCRSAAERLTLLHMLPESVRKAWGPSIRLGYEGLFHRYWTYVESVRAVDQTVTFHFNPNVRKQCKFQGEFEYREDGRDIKQFWRGEVSNTSRPLAFRLNAPKRGVATLKLDNCVAFCGRINFEDVPF